MDAEILFIGNTTYDILGVLKKDISSSRFNELMDLGYSFGGKAANAAVYCANLGVKAAYIGTVGSDFESIGYQKYLKDLSVDTSDVFSMKQKTPRFFSFRWETKDYSFVTPTKLTNNQLNQFQEHLRKVVLEHPAKLVYCAIGNEEIVLEVFKNAKKSGKKTAWNPIKSFQNRERIEKTLCETDFLFVNRDEAAALEASLSLSSSNFYQNYGIAIICITLGENGCRLIDNGIVINIPTIRVDVVDTIGAGDAFAGTFLASTHLFDSTRLCAELACIAGSLVVQSFGTQVNMFTLDVLQSLRATL